MKTAAVIVTAVLGFASVAGAQPALTQPLPPPAAPHAEDEVNETAALMLSLGGTAAAYGLIVAGAYADANDDGAGGPLVAAGVLGTFFAPSFGHWYAHSFATRGMAIRGLASAGMMVGGLVALSECPLFSDEPCDTNGADVLIIASAIAYAVGTVDDIVSAPRKAREYNRRGRSSLAILPVARRDSGGFALVGTF